MNKALANAFYKQLTSLLESYITIYTSAMKGCNAEDKQFFKNTLGKLCLVKGTLSCLPSNAPLIVGFKTFLDREGARDNIDQKNDKFFLSMDVDPDVEKKFGFLKQIYMSADEPSRVSLWKYMNVFRQLSEKYTC